MPIRMGFQCCKRDLTNGCIVLPAAPSHCCRTCCSSLTWASPSTHGTSSSECFFSLFSFFASLAVLLFPVPHGTSSSEWV